EEAVCFLYSLVADDRGDPCVGAAARFAPQLGEPDSPDGGRKTKFARDLAGTQPGSVRSPGSRRTAGHARCKIGGGWGRNPIPALGPHEEIREFRKPAGGRSAE